MILIVTQVFAPARGGIEALMTGLAESLAAKGHKVAVCADRTGKQRGEYTPHTPFALHRFAGWRPWRRWRKRQALHKLTKHETIDAVFCDSWKSIAALPDTIKAPVSLFIHGAEFPLHPTPRKSARIAAALARATTIIANSRFTAGLARPFLSADGPQPLIIHPPIDAQPEPSANATATIDALIKDRGPILAVVSRLEERKGIDRVIAALPALRARFPGILFMIAGGGGDRDRLQALASELGVTRQVHFLGMVDAETKAALLQRTDVFAMPSRRVGRSVEGYGLSFIEAAWHGVPALAGAEGGAADAVIDGVTGLLCDGANQSAVTTALARLLDDGDRRRAMGEAARRRARENFTWDFVLPRYLETVRLPPA